MSDALAQIDRVMNLLELLKSRVARLSELAEECGRGKGDVYMLYQLILKLEDMLRELRRMVFEECGGSAAAGPRHNTQR